ncbi:MAG TPA: acyl-CoA dehydrogenase family protein, partial [Marmoricola sp.]|nr:acyl-CoA dehydrogenase family protein [Marmoricola sp.]
PFTQTSWGAIPTIELDQPVRSVAGAIEADVLLVPIRADGRIALTAVAAEDAEVTPVSSLDMTRQLADVTIRNGGEIIDADAEAVIRKALLFGAGLLASEQLGVARWCLEETVSYLKVRRQFGRVVGGFMALKHRLADLYTEVESAAAAARYAAATLAEGAEPMNGSDAEVAVALAQAYCSQVAVHAAEEAVQLHGGIGMTWEHPVHLYLKKAKADQIGFGAPGAHRAHLATLVNIPS